MALKPGTKEFEDWRKKNFNLKIKVSEATIQKLRDGKTPQNNINKYAGTKDAQIREAMNRFYGKGWEKKAKGPSSGGSAGGSKGGSTKPSDNKPAGPISKGKPQVERQMRVSPQGNPGSSKSKSKGSSYAAGRGVPNWANPFKLDNPRMRETASMLKKIESGKMSAASKTAAMERLVRQRHPNITKVGEFIQSAKGGVNTPLGRARSIDKAAAAKNAAAIKKASAATKTTKAAAAAKVKAQGAAVARGNAAADKLMAGAAKSGKGAAALRALGVAGKVLGPVGNALQVYEASKMATSMSGQRAYAAYRKAIEDGYQKNKGGGFTYANMASAEAAKAAKKKKKK